jgi:hypothetical protein
MGRDEVPVDDRLPQQHAGHRFGTPALGVGVRDKISLQPGLGGKHAVDGHCRDRFSGGLDSEGIGEVAADPECSRGRDDLMSGAALGDGTPEQTLGAGQSSVPTLIAPADSPKTVTLFGSPPKAAMLS